ncbi:hypothetical protein D918_02671 [Trichuris suis]|nr:hypothetical protein D918_02671 [Trichuris suis]
MENAINTVADWVDGLPRRCVECFRLFSNPGDFLNHAELCFMESIKTAYVEEYAKRHGLPVPDKSSRGHTVMPEHVEKEQPRNRINNMSLKTPIHFRLYATVVWPLHQCTDQKICLWG